MLKIKCISCKHSDVYENEKHAYMAGWNWVGKELKTTVCWDCYNKKKPTVVSTSDTDYNNEEDEE